VRSDSLEAITERMRHGDRAAVAEFLARHGPAIRARVRHTLSRRLRRVFDSEDILSTVSRRLDALVADRRLEASEAAQVWALIYAIARHATWEKVRGERRQDAAVDGAALSFEGRRATQADRSEVAESIDGLHALVTDPTDRELLRLRGHGCSHEQAATALDLEPAAVRMRWSRLRRVIQARTYEQGGSAPCRDTDRTQS